MAKEFWRTLKPGMRVRVKYQPGLGDSLDEAFVGRCGSFVRYTEPHRYARVALDGETLDALVHPESLEPEVNRG